MHYTQLMQSEINDQQTRIIETQFNNLTFDPSMIQFQQQQSQKQWNNNLMKSTVSSEGYTISDPNVNF